MYGILYLLMSLSSIYVTNAIHCGFPGRPAYGRALQVADSYAEGQAVTYTCNSGYYMVGTVIRRCLPNGTWTGNIPVCDTTLLPVGYTSSSEALSLYPPELAIDGNKRSCFYSNRRKPRWWRLDMGTPQTVLSVSITVPFASSEHHFSIYVIEVNDTTTATKYQKCAAFRGIFSSQSMVLSCGLKGITGSVLHIEDNSQHLDYFGLCEVEVFVRKEFYECGQPEIPTNSFIIDKPSHIVTYGCHNGYKLEGSNQRSCMKTGQWSGSQPICREIICPKPATIDNGNLRVIGHTNSKPALGGRVIYTCQPGYTISSANATQYCQENGTWSDKSPECLPIDCGPPNDHSEYLGGRFKLMNGSTKYLSTAELICYSGKRSGLVIRCGDDGLWSGLDATCIYNKMNYYTANTSESMAGKDSDISVATILASVIAAVLLILIVVVFLLFKKKILHIKWSSNIINGRRASWAMEALRSTNIGLRKPFRFQTNSDGKQSQTSSAKRIHSSIKSVSTNLENVYEEIANFSSNPISEETEHKIRSAALIAAELAAISGQKQSYNPSTNPLSKSQLPLYARVDLIQKHRNRLLRQQTAGFTETYKMHNNSDDEYTDGPDTNAGTSSCSSSGNSGHRKLHHTKSNPEILGQTSGIQPEFKTIRVSSLDLSNARLLKDNMIFVGHPALTTCDNLSQLVTDDSNSNVTHIYTINH